MLLSQRRDPAAARRFFTRALRAGTVPAKVTTEGRPFIQNLRRKHCELAIDVPARHRLHEAFDQLTTAI